MARAWGEIRLWDFGLFCCPLLFEGQRSQEPGNPHSLHVMYAYTRARVQCFSIFAFTSSPFGCKSLIDCALRVKASPFCLHRFFVMEVVQGVVFQIIAVKLKVKAGFAFTLKRLIYSLLWANVKGEGKNGKFAECAGAYIRVGACPTRRVKGNL